MSTPLFYSRKSDLSFGLCVKPLEPDDQLLVYSTRKYAAACPFIFPICFRICTAWFSYACAGERWRRTDGGAKEEEAAVVVRPPPPFRNWIRNQLLINTLSSYNRFKPSSSPFCSLPIQSRPIAKVCQRTVHILCCLIRGNRSTWMPEEDWKFSTRLVGLWLSLIGYSGWIDFGWWLAKKEMGINK